jgi:hypothetical protein
MFIYSYLYVYSHVYVYVYWIYSYIYVYVYLYTLYEYIYIGTHGNTCKSYQEIVLTPLCHLCPGFSICHMSKRWCFQQTSVIIAQPENPSSAHGVSNGFPASYLIQMMAIQSPKRCRAVMRCTPGPRALKVSRPAWAVARVAPQRHLQGWDPGSKVPAAIPWKANKNGTKPQLPQDIKLI